MRLDAWLVQHGYFDSRQRALMAIKAGQVLLNGQPAGKASLLVRPTDQVVVTGEPLRYVSRGGLKLEKAIRTFGLDFSGRVVLDAGASTGGFTDCALQHGAARVIAVDAGTGQLAGVLRKRPEVVFFENLDIRDLTLEQMGGDAADAAVADLSFISLTLVLPALRALVKPGGFLVLLIKPQFEMERRTALKGGIVKDPAMRRSAVQRVLDCAAALGFRFYGIVETDVEEAGKKNVEYLGYFTNG